MKEPGKAHGVAVLITLPVVWILSGPQPVMAQRSGGATSPPPGSTRSSTHPYTSPVDMNGRPVGAGNMSLENWRREKYEDTETTLLRRRVAAELAEDFDSLSRINRERVLLLLSPSSLDYKRLSQVTSEINRRAKRIKSNTPLALRIKKGEKPAYEVDAARLGSMLPELSRLIDSFLGNPVFHTASFHDAELRSTAGRDLERIIRLSETVNKIAKRLNSASTQAVNSTRER
jgi:hypothetical protein